MAEANRAYEQRDADRLRLIIRAWHVEPSGLACDAIAAEDDVRRRISTATGILARLQIELEDLRQSAIAQLKLKVETTRAQGWDLFSNMVAQLQHDIARETTKLLKLQRQPSATVAFS
jgi:hypothetical protein